MAPMEALEGNSELPPEALQPVSPLDKIIVAVAGPLFSFLLAFAMAGMVWALGKLAADPWPGQRHWTAPPGSRLLGLLRFFASAPPSPWSNLT